MFSTKEQSTMWYKLTPIAYLWVPILGWAMSNMIYNKIGPIEIFVCCTLTLLSLCPAGCLCLAFLKLFWHHQIWIQNNLGFMVSELTYIYFFHCTTVQLCGANIHRLNPSFKKRMNSNFFFWWYNNISLEIKTSGLGFTIEDVFS